MTSVFGNLLSRQLRPSFMVIGAQKGGTTALFHYLSRHPQVRAPIEKEIDYFSNAARHARGEGYYHSFFPHCRRWGRPPVTFDCTPAYLQCAEAPRRIHAYEADMKMLVLLRNPVDRAYSAWRMYRTFRQTDYDGWLRYLRQRVAEPAEMAFRDTSFGQSFVADLESEVDLLSTGKVVEFQLLDHGLYARQLERFYAFFPRARLLIEPSEALRDETAATLDEVTAFRIWSATAGGVAP